MNLFRINEDKKNNPGSEKEGNDDNKKKNETKNSSTNAISETRKKLKKLSENFSFIKKDHDV